MDLAVRTGVRLAEMAGTGTMDNDSERAAILATLNAETHAYLRKDYADWASYWIHDETALRWSYYPWAGIVIDRGWEKISSGMRAAMERFSEPVNHEYRIENLEMRIGAEMAWVTYDEISDHAEDPFDFGPLHRNLKILHKTPDGWKLACLSVLRAENINEDRPIVETDGSGRIRNTNAAARTELDGHPCLTVSQGILKARERQADRDLQAAIKWGASLDHFAQQRAALSGHETSGKVPVVLGDAETGDPCICWVTPLSGTVRVYISDEGAVRRGVATAALIYRLSPAQSKLAQLIVRGADTKSAALELGVSPNTTRTQLVRIFEKTGVHNQTALVRALLSASPAGG